MSVLGGSKKLKLAYCMKYQLTVFHGGSKKISYTPQKIVSVCFGGVLKNWNWHITWNIDWHKKPNISATVVPTREKFIYSGRYLKGGSFWKKIGQGGWAAQKCWMGGSPKLVKSNLTYQLQTFIKHLTVNDNNNNAYWAEISAKFWLNFAKCLPKCGW